MTRPESNLENALRSLPLREGHADWQDIQSRLRRRRPFHLRLLKHAGTLKWVSVCMGVLLLVGFWQALQGRRSVTASRSQELRTWVTAHDQAVESDPFEDPWSQSIAESNR
jgi:hypothetical protein